MSCQVWYRVFKQTMNMLAMYRSRVREGVLVEDCHDFARYIRLSGLAELMAENPPLGETPLHTKRLRELFPYNGAALRCEADLLDAECCEYYRGKTRDADGTAAGVKKSDLESINRNMQLIAGRLAALESVKRARVRKPKLHVVSVRAAS